MWCTFSIRYAAEDFKMALFDNLYKITYSYIHNSIHPYFTWLQISWTCRICSCSEMQKLVPVKLCCFLPFLSHKTTQQKHLQYVMRCMLTSCGSSNIGIYMHVVIGFLCLLGFPLAWAHICSLKPQRSFCISCPPPPFCLLPLLAGSGHWRNRFIRNVP